VFVPRVRKTIKITYHEHDWRAKGLNETKSWNDLNREAQRTVNNPV
jgi:hypothetical protein